MDKKLSCFQVYGYCKVAINVLKKINTLLTCGVHFQQVTNRWLNALQKLLSTKPPTLVLDLSSQRGNNNQC